MPPAGGSAGAKSRARVSLDALTNPMQFGLTSLIPDDLQMSSSSSCAALPSAPVSAKPAEIMHKARTPAAAHQSRGVERRAGRTATKASSGVSGRSLISA